MPLIIQEASLDDISDIARIHFSAFHQDNPVDRLIFPKGLTPAILQCSIASHTQAFKDNSTRYWKIVLKTDNPSNENVDHQHGEDAAQSDLGSQERIIAFSRWYDWREERARIEWDKPADIKDGSLGPAEEVSYEIARTYMGSLRDHRREHLRGVPCLCK